MLAMGWRIRLLLLSLSTPQLLSSSAIQPLTASAAQPCNHLTAASLTPRPSDPNLSAPHGLSGSFTPIASPAVPQPSSLYVEDVRLGLRADGSRSGGLEPGSLSSEVLAGDAGLGAKGLESKGFGGEEGAGGFGSEVRVGLLAEDVELARMPGVNGFTVQGAEGAESVEGANGGQRSEVLVTSQALNTTQINNSSHLTFECDYTSCQEPASYGPPGTNIKLYCHQHRKYWHINTELGSQHHDAEGAEGLRGSPLGSSDSIRDSPYQSCAGSCQVPGCHRRATFGNRGESRSHCAKHKLKGQVDVNHKKCRHRDCKRQPSYAVSGQPPEFCSLHKGPQMTNVVARLCASPGCTRQSSFGVLGKRPVHCALHRSGMEINVRHHMKQIRKASQTLKRDGVEPVGIGSVADIMGSDVFKLSMSELRFSVVELRKRLFAKATSESNCDTCSRPISAESTRTLQLARLLEMEIDSEAFDRQMMSFFEGHGDNLNASYPERNGAAPSVIGIGH